MMMKKLPFAALCLALVIGALPTAPASAQAPPPDRRFGAVDVANHDPATYAISAAAAVEAGVSWERIIFYWSELQRQGPNDWNGYHVPDNWLNQATAAGREVAALLKHTPAWATDGVPGCGVPRGLDLPVDDPNNLWASFVRKTVEMYRGRISHWIIWNEPDIAPGDFSAEWCGSVEEYYQLLKVAYLVAHQADPNAVIHLAGLTYFHDTQFGRPYYLERLLAVAAQDPSGPEHGYYFDVVSLHIYFEIKNFPVVVRATRRALAAYGLAKPIWINETDAPPNTDPDYPLPEANFKISLEEQASFMLQAFSLALSEGVERIAVYKMVVDNPPVPGREPNGIIRPDGSRRPAFDAYKLITTHYAGVTSATREERPSYTVVTLNRGNLTTRVLWASTQAAATVTLAALAPQGRLIDQTGAEQPVQAAGGFYTIALPGARCADARGCIIGGPTYLLVEESTSAPPPAEAPTPELSDLSTPASPPETPIPTPLPTPTPTPIPSPSPTLSPTPTPTPTPTSTPIPSPSLSPSPSPSPPHPPTEPEGSTWIIVIGLAVVLLIAAAIGTVFKRQI